MSKVKIWSYFNELKEDRIEILSAMEKVLDSGTLILGKNVENFEKSFASYCGVTHGVGVDNATNGLFLALKALGIKSGDEVITVSNTAVPTVSAIVQSGAVPRFVDIDPDTCLMDVQKIEKVIGKKTKAIIAVHLYGQCVEMDAITEIAKQHHLSVIEDCAQSHGAMYKGKMAGSMSDAAVFSFYPTKPLGTYGDGGMIVTRQKKLSDKIKMLRFYGMDRTYYSEFPGFNSRLDEIHAAILLIKLKKLNERNQERRKRAEYYNKNIKSRSITPIQLKKHNQSAHHLYVIQCKDRNKVQSILKKNGIETRIHYPYPIHLMRGFQKYGNGIGSLPVTERISKKILSLPFYTHIPYQTLGRICDLLNKN